jgi:hypothetical protein
MKIMQATGISVRLWAPPAFPWRTDEVKKIAALGTAALLCVIPFVVLAEGSESVSTDHLVVPLGVALGALVVILGAVFSGIGILWRSVEKMNTASAAAAKTMASESKAFAKELSDQNEQAITKLANTVGSLASTMHGIELQLARENVSRADLDEVWKKMRKMDKRLALYADRLQRMDPSFGNSVDGIPVIDDED